MWRNLVQLKCVVFSLATGMLEEIVGGAGGWPLQNEQLMGTFFCGF